VARLRCGGYALLDAQFITDHLTTFGAQEISRTQYRARLAAALEVDGDFYSVTPGAPGAGILQAISQTS
jgi:leucyl/phenylalanyl-tRNA--protein transferase